MSRAGPVVLGLDVSTTATKAILVGRGGDLVGVAASEYATSSPHPLWSEQDPELWWRAARRAIGEVLAASGRSGRDVAAVGLSGQMHGLTLLDDAGAPVRPAILWNDQRTARRVRPDPRARRA